ncbi:endonuclease V [Candidatus Bipolaricaulota bacterium]|nr:endonuclease V [Candidatus Bipolaricaulota bacterium]
METELRVPDLARTLRELVGAIPAGKVTTYRALAETLGDPGAAPFVASWLASTEAEGLPGHRVVYASGAVGRAWGGTQAEAAARLAAEGVRVAGARVDPLARYFVWNFPTDRPLARLQEEQAEVARRVVLAPLPAVETIGALDVAYPDREAVAAFALADRDGEILDHLTVRAPVTFPYIRTYLAYRELPPYLAAIAEADARGWRPDVYLVDGNGILHPRRAGIASHLGVLLDRPTVGIAKGHLCGHANTAGMTIGEWRPVVLDDDTVGAALRTDRNRTLFVSPGHRADLESAVELVQALTEKTALPPPLQWAHELATEAAHAARGG